MNFKSVIVGLIGLFVLQVGFADEEIRGARLLPTEEAREQMIFSTIIDDVDTIKSLLGSFEFNYRAIEKYFIHPFFLVKSFDSFKLHYDGGKQSLEQRYHFKDLDMISFFIMSGKIYDRFKNHEEYGEKEIVENFFIKSYKKLGGVKDRDELSYKYVKRLALPELEKNKIINFILEKRGDNFDYFVNFDEFQMSPLMYMFLVSDEFLFVRIKDKIKSEWLMNTNHSGLSVFHIAFLSEDLLGGKMNDWLTLMLINNSGLVSWLNSESVCFSKFAIRHRLNNEDLYKKISHLLKDSCSPKELSFTSDIVQDFLDAHFKVLDPAFGTDNNAGGVGDGLGNHYEVIDLEKKMNGK